MENMKELRAVDSLEEATRIIRNELENITEGFIAVGYYLKKVRDDGMYSQEGYASLFEYAKETFGISRFTAARFMEINDKYSIGGYSPQIEDRWRGYGSSKLTEMLGLPEEIAEEVPKEATVADIREAKKTIRETESHYGDQYELCDIAPEGHQDEPDDWITALVKHFFLHEGREKYKEFALWAKTGGPDRYGADADIMEIINPSKFRMTRMDRANVMMHASGVRVIPYRGQGDVAEYTYMDFAETFRDIFCTDDGKSSEESFLQVYGEPLGGAENPPHLGNTRKDSTSAPEKVMEKPGVGKTGEKQAPEPPEKAEPESPPLLGNTRCGADSGNQEEEQVPGQMEITKDMSQYCPDAQEEAEEGAGPGEKQEAGESPGEDRESTEESREFMNQPEEGKEARTVPEREPEDGRRDEVHRDPEEAAGQIQEGQVIEDILASGDGKRIMKLLIQEFAEPAAGWMQWLKKVVVFDGKGL